MGGARGSAPGGSFGAPALCVARLETGSVNLTSEAGWSVDAVARQSDWRLCLMKDVGWMEETGTELLMMEEAVWLRLIKGMGWMEETGTELMMMEGTVRLCLMKNMRWIEETGIELLMMEEAVWLCLMKKGHGCLNTETVVRDCLNMAVVGHDVAMVVCDWLNTVKAGHGCLNAVEVGLD